MMNKYLMWALVDPEESKLHIIRSSSETLGVEALRRPIVRHRPHPEDHNPGANLWYAYVHGIKVGRPIRLTNTLAEWFASMVQRNVIPEVRFIEQGFATPSQIKKRMMDAMRTLMVGGWEVLTTHIATPRKPRGRMSVFKVDGVVGMNRLKHVADGRYDLPT